MASRCAVALSCLLASLTLEHGASANGRPPGTSSIHFRRGLPQEIAVGLSFGLLVSRDGGATWHWMCEDAIGYGGIYDPDYVFTSSGALLATTLDGLRVMRDGCTFGPIGSKFVSAVAQGPDGKLYHATVDTPSTTNPGDSSIYRSDDDGAHGPAGGDLLQAAPASGERRRPDPQGGARVAGAAGGQSRTTWRTD